MTRGWRPVLNVADAVEAQAARDYLRAHHVDCHLHLHTDPSLSGVPVSPGWGELWVRDEDEDRSRELFRRWEEDPPQTVAEQKPDAPSESFRASAPRLRWQRRSASGLGWMLLLSLVTNAILVMLWWDAEQRATERATSEPASH